MSFRRRALFLAGLFVAVSCSDAGNLAGPDDKTPVPPRPREALQELICTVQVESGSMSCEPTRPDLGAASGIEIGGANGVNVNLTSTGHVAPPDADSLLDGVYSFNVTIENRIVQPLGQFPNGDADSIRVYFSRDPAATVRYDNGQPGPVSVKNPNGTSLFAGGMRDYFAFAGPLTNNQVSPALNWQFDVKNVKTFSFGVTVSAPVPHPQGWVEISPNDPLMDVGETVLLTATVRNQLGKGVPDGVTWSTSSPGIVTVTQQSDSTADITGVAEGQVWVKANPVVGSRDADSVLVTVNNTPVVALDSIDGLMNVTDSIAAPRLQNNVTSGGGTVVAGTVTTAKGGTATIYADGGFTYLGKAGFFGKDTITYQVNDGLHTVNGKVVVQVAQSNYWYVRQGASGDGRDRFPAASLAQVQDSALAGDSILVLLPADNVSPLTGSITLDNQQGLLGQGIASSITRTLNGHSVTILAAGAAPGIQTATGASVTLGQDNVIEGLGITASAGAGITGASFTTLRVRQVSVGATGGPALSLTSGTLDAEFGTLSSSGSPTSGISLGAVDGSLAASGAISGAAGGGIAVSGGSVDVAYGGNVTQSASAALLSVSGNHTGDLVFNTGTLSATAGTGLQFNDADGTYAFNGTTTLAGGDAGVDIANGSGGTFTFGTGTSVTSPSGTAFTVNGSSPAVTYSGNLTQGSNALLVDVSEQPGGTVTFQTGTLSATNGAGILLSNADGTVSFNGTTTLNGGDAGVDLASGAGGTFSFSSGASITNPTGPGLSSMSSAPASLTYAGTIAANTNRPVSIDGGCGTITVSGAVSSTGQGILVQNCASGAVAFNGSKTLNTGANQAVTLTSNGSATVSFGGGNLAITTAGGTGFGASGGGTVQVTGANNTISTGTGTGLSLNGVGTGASGVTFRSVSTGAAANGIALNNLTGVGVSVTGDGSTGGSGGSISGTTGHGVSLTSLGSLTTGVALSYLNVTTGAAGIASVFGTTFGTVAFTGNVLASTGGPVLNLTTGTTSGTIASLSSSGSSTTGVSLTGVAGTLNATGGTIAGGTTGAFTVSGGTVGGSIGAAVSQATASAPLLSILGGHNTGTFTFTNTVSATNGTGLQFTDADGTYTFTGNFSLNGAGDEGIDIAAASAGTINVTPAGGNTAAITSPSGIAIAVLGGSADLNYAGNVTQASAQPLLSVSGGHTGDLAFPSGTLNASNGSGLQFDNADGTYDFDGTVTLNGGDAGIDITNGSGGTFTFPTTASITSPSTGNLISILNSAPSFTYSGGLTKANNNVTAINIQSNTGGTVTFNGDATTADGDPADVARTLNSGSAAAVNFASNAAGTTLNFNGGGLNITSAAGAGFSATGGGTVNVTGAGNVISSGTGTGLHVLNTTIGASGLSFVSISHSGGANGIFLSGTGSTNGLQVTGTGAVGSGGSILNVVGGNGTTAGSGVYLNSVRNVVLTSMIINDSQNFGIYGETVNGFTLDNSRLAGTHGNDINFDESVISITGLSGQAVFSNDSITGGIEDNVRILNHGVVSPATDSILFNNVRMGHVNAASGNTALLVRVADGSNNRVRVRNSTFHGSRGGSMFHLNVVNTATARLALASNTFHNTQAQISGAGGVLITASGTAASVPTLTYSVTGNTFRGSRTVALNINKDVGLAVINGTVSNNVIGVAGINDSGSLDASGLQLRHLGGGTHRATVTNNQIFQYGNYGIILEAGDAVAGGGHGRMDITATGNTISNPGTQVFAQQGMHVNFGLVTDDAHILCLAASGNSLDNSGDSQDIRLRQRMKTTILLPGYGGSASDNTAVNAFVNAANGGNAALVVAASNSVGVASPNGPGNGFTNGSCNAPTL